MNNMQWTSETNLMATDFLGEYLEVGVLAVWVVYPRSRRLLIYRLDQDGPAVLTEAEVLDEVPELPGFRCTIADLFV